METSKVAWNGDKCGGMEWRQVWWHGMETSKMVWNGDKAWNWNGPAPNVGGHSDASMRDMMPTEPTPR